MSKFDFHGPGLKVKVTVATFSTPEHSLLGMSYCDCPVSMVHCPQFASNDIFPVTTGQISTKFDRIVPWEVLYQIVPLCCTKWPPELKLEKTSNNIFSVTTGRISTKLDRIVLWEVFYQNCSNCSTPLHKMATRAKNRIYFK